jgi:hypothetical protein
MANIEYSEPLIRSLEDGLRGTFGLSYLRLSREPHNSGNEFVVQLADVASSARLDNGDEQAVIEIASVGRADTFYLGFEAVFEFATEEDSRKGSRKSVKRRYILKTISLTVFHRVIQDIVPMFRAEWDRAHAADATAIHAQPHWHFVQSPKRIERLVRSSSGPITEVSEFDSQPQQSPLFSGIADCGSFHFAMSSHWEKGDVPPLKRVFDSQDFYKWFLGLTKYIAGQLEFLALKMPKNDAHAFPPVEIE